MREEAVREEVRKGTWCCVWLSNRALLPQTGRTAQQYYSPGLQVLLYRYHARV